MSMEPMTQQQADTTPSGQISAVGIAEGLKDIYAGFTESLSANTADGKKRQSRLTQSALQWITGGRVKTERDVLCDKFLQDVQKQLQMMDLALEGRPEEEVQEACAVAADILTEIVPEKSNHTSALMKRAMIGQVQPYLSRLSRVKLEELQKKIEGAYKKSQRLPVEQEVLKEIKRLLS